jgi:glycosyltransferase involved in cell wall biosynthesis
MKVVWFGHKAKERGDGLITYSREIIKGLEARGAEVIFFYRGDKTKEDPENGRLGSFNIFNHDLVSVPRTKEIIDEVLEQERVDVVHASLSFSLLNLGLPDICHDRSIPIVVTLHFPYDRRPTIWGRGARVLYRLWSILLAKYDTEIIFSEEQRDIDILARYGIPLERLEVIPNGVDVDRFQPGVPNYKEESKAELILTYCERIDPEKKVGAFLQAFQEMELPSSHKAVVIGEGSEYRKLRERYSISSIILTGLIADQAELIRMLQASDIFVLPSEVEGLSLALLEGMACGLATVATDVGCSGEVLRGAGIVIQSGEESQLRLALQLLADYPGFRHRLVEEARKRVVERYSLNGNIDRLTELYRRLLGRAA